jgi:hypothetical protein
MLLLYTGTLKNIYGAYLMAMKQKRVSAIALSAAAAMLTFSGCGGGGGSAGVASPAPTPTTPTATASLQQPALIVAAEPTANGATETNAFFATLEGWADTTVNTLAGTKAGGTTTLSGNLTTQTLDANVLYSINGTVVIPNDVTVTIPANTVLYGETAASYLVVEKGGSLVVNGTTAEPVIFTSKNDVTTGSALSVAGEWGGVSMFGTATTNKGVVNYEAGSFTFGGSNDAEGSSTINNMVIMHSGYEVEVDAELNGLSLGGVGSGTTINGIAVIGSQDDGVELWGGTVNLDNVYIKNAMDDSLDMDLGYTGTITNIWIQQAANSDHGIEADNNGGNMTATPITDPTINGITIVGGSSADDAIKLREGMGGDFNGAKVVVNNPAVYAVDISDQQTFDNNAFSFTNTDLVSNNMFFTGTDAAEAKTRFETDATNKQNGVKDLSALGATETNAFFATLEGWADTTVNTLAGTKAGGTTTLSGNLTTQTLDANVLYSINGTVVIPNDVTVTIPANTVLYGETAASYLVVEKGGSLVVNGTTAEPVIFTSKNDVTTGSALSVAGEWGGVSMFGTATTNKGVVNYEAGSFTFGGSNDAEGSSTINNMVIMHSGYEVEVDAELNGLSLGGVGSGTTINGIAVIGSQDDGVELWGGTVNLDNVYIKNAMDDSLDMDLGYTGTITNIWIQQAANSDHGIEADNNGGNMTATPITDPTINGITIVGGSSADDAIKLREGMGGDFNGAKVVVNNPAVYAVDISDQQTFDNNAFSFTNTAFVSSNDQIFKGDDTTMTNTMVQRFSAEATNLYGHE